MSKPRLYSVTSREYEMSSGGEYEPPEYGCDYALVRATTAKRAVVLATRWWRRISDERLQRRFPRLRGLESRRLSRYWDENPFTGVTAKRVRCECGAYDVSYTHYDECRLTAGGA